MPIYSNLYSNLSRQGLTKTFTHGYVQSVVAVTHPSTYPSQQHRVSFSRRPGRPSKLASYHFQNAFHHSAGASTNTLQDGRSEKSSARDSGLDAYFDAWAKEHVAGEPEKEWTQFQFQKRIEWKPLNSSTDVVDGEHTQADGHSLERSYSVSAVDDLKKSHFDEAEAAALAHIDAAITREIELQNRRTLQAAEDSLIDERVPIPPVAPYQSPALTINSDVGASSISTAPTTASNVTDSQSQSYADHLTKLSDAGRYAEIPAVFEAMLVGGIKPTADAYNALLDAAIRLPTERIQVVPKALDVYADMLRRKVVPNSTTYKTLIDLVASRSLEVSSMRKSLEARRVRFGGMEEPGKFMLASTEMEHDILAEDDRLDLAVKLFDASTAMDSTRSYPSDTYMRLISACSETAKVLEMVRVYEHMESRRIAPLGGVFPPMIKGFAASGDLSSAVECYNEYKSLVIASDSSKAALSDRQDADVYASVIRAYISSDKLDGAMKFYHKIVDTYGEQAKDITDSVLSRGIIQGLLERGNFDDAITWASKLEHSGKDNAMAKIATFAADYGNADVASAAFGNIPSNYSDIATPSMAMLAMNIRGGDVASASKFWQILSSPTMSISSSLIEPTAMYSVALIGSGQVAEGMAEANSMFSRIRASATESSALLSDEVDEGVHFVSNFMAARGIAEPQQFAAETMVYPSTPFTPVSSFSAVPTAPSFEDTFDPYASSTDFKGSSLIADELEKGNGRGKGSKLNEALGRFRNIRRAGRHPRYITYAKLISAAAREERMNLIHDILGMARSDIPLLTQYPVVRYGWVSILDAMVGACLTTGNRALAARYHQELLDMGAAPTANTFGLYITTLKESTKTFDEASEAVKIFHQAKNEGVEPSSFLYNALIGKLGKARRIDDCLFYFAQMRSLGIRPTSVTYGTIVNALCRVSDEKFAEELFEEMESMPNYKARPAPYNSLMQFFLTTKRDKKKVLAYFERMQSKGIQPTSHTFKLLVDTHATLEPINMSAAESVLDVVRRSGLTPEAVHYAALIHAKGCVMHDMDGARAIFDSVLADPSIRPQACLYQALFESMVANHHVSDTEAILKDMGARRVEMTPYIANTLIHGWANESNIAKSEAIFAQVNREKREPSTYEAMTRAYLAVRDRLGAKGVVREMLGRGYPSAVAGKIMEIVGGGSAEPTL